ncbi:MAG: amino acid adenylation domain-containing protein [Phormidesmis sp.]
MNHTNTSTITGARLSSQQEQLWLQHDGSIYLAHCTLLIAGSLNPERLKETLQRVIDRHEILRTTFHRPAGIKLPFQVIAEESSLSWQTMDLSGLSPEVQQRKIDSFQVGSVRNESSQAALSACLATLSPQRSKLLLSLPSLCADTRTLQNLVGEICQLYSANSQPHHWLATGADDPSEDPLQYADFCEWQHDLLTADDETTQAGKAHWQQYDLTTLSKVELSAVDGLPKPQTEPQTELARFEPGSVTVALGEEAIASLSTFANRQGTTLSVCLQACWQTLLWRLTGQDDLILGTVFDGRPYEDLEDAMGLFARTLPISCHFEAETPFSKLLQQIHQATCTASDWQNFWSPAAVSPLTFPFSYEYEERPSPLPAGDLSICLQQANVCADRFGIKLTCVRTPEQLTATFYYDTHRYSAATLQRLSRYFQTLLESVQPNPQTLIDRLPILSPADRHQLLLKFNPSPLSFTPSLLPTLHQQFTQQAIQTPTQTALIFENQTLTYAELNRRANQLANYLQQLGVGPEVPVALCLPRSLEMVVVLLGILKAGGAYVPLDPHLPPARLTFMLADSQSPVLLTQAPLALSPPETLSHVVCLDTDSAAIDQESDQAPASGVTDNNLAYIIYTSGSTGQPKGVAVEHRQVMAYTQSMLDRLALPHQSSYATLSTLSADLGNTAIFPALCSGGTLHAIAAERATDPVGLAAYCRQHPIDCLKITPSHLDALLSGDNAADLLPRQRLVLGGEAASWRLVETVHSLTPACQILNHYGPTESTVGVLAYPVPSPPEMLTASATLPLGQPLPHAQVYILDPYGEPVPIGVAGELHIGGASMARGYYHRPELTAERFIYCNWAETGQQRLYKTGDSGRYRADGTIEFLGRLDHQVKLRGFRIELGEIEAALADHPAVTTAAVTVWTEAGSQQLVAYVVSSLPGATLGQTLATDLKQQLPDYMVPTHFVKLQILPLTLNGKLDRQALPSPHAVSATDSSANRRFTAPCTPQEKLLADLWCDLLQVEKVSIHDNFFELGGDSILSIQVIARANQAGLRLLPKQLFKHQTIARLAAVAETALPTQAEQGLVSGPVPLTPIQHWFFEQNLAEPHHFNQSVLLTVPADLNPDHLTAVVQQVLSHHDALRHRFEQVENQWQQICSPPGQVTPVTRLDLSHLSSDEQPAALKAAIADVQTRLDLSAGPLFRAALFQLGSDQPLRLLMTAHHLLVDGVSWRILLADFTTVYQQLKRGEAIQLPAKTTAFKAWSERLSDYAQSADLAAEQDHWLSQPQVAALPVDALANGSKPEPQDNLVSSAKTLSVTLSEAQTQALLQKVPPAYKTQINDVLLTALVQSFAQWTGDHTLLLDLEGHGREDLFDGVDISRTVGWFTTHFPLWLTLDQDAPLGVALKSVKEQLRQVPQRGIGYGLLRYLCQDSATRQQLQALPPAEVIFNYLGQFDQALSESPDWSPAPESIGPTRSSLGRRRYLLEINGFVSSGQLHLNWTYSERVHQRQTIQALAEAFIRCLSNLIAHCQAPDAQRYTPSDFPLAKMDQPTLDRLLTGCQPIADLYPLSPAQQGLLFHTLYAPNSGVYCVQLSYSLRGNLNVSAFRRACEAVVQRHPILRTAFLWKGLEMPLQRVCQTIQLPWEQLDWRSLTTPEQSTQLEQFLQETRSQGFELDQPPLVRCALIRVSADTHQFVWSHHHLLMDGWCLPIICKEILTLYEAFNNESTVELPLPARYRDYIAWLQQQDLNQAKRFWQQTLQGFKAPTQLMPTQSANSTESPQADAPHSIQSRRLSPSVTTALQALARRHRLTLNTLVQGMWALLLSHYSKDPDVVFGMTVSGRPPALAGVESMVGLFINTLPVRAKVSGEEALTTWLQQLQADQVALHPYAYTPLVEIQTWSDVPRGQPLFESIVVFENYPLDTSLQASVGSLEIDNLRSVTINNFPLTVRVTPGTSLLLQLLYQPERFEERAIATCLDQFETLLHHISADPDISLATLQRVLADFDQQQADMQAKQFQETSHQKFKTIQRKPVRG